MTDDRPSPPRRRPARLVPWILLALALGWSAAIRVPIVLNAEDHLDSDLAVDGLTLLDAVNGRWRWHYPGTPFIGIGGVLLSYPQALVFGVGPETLVSGGAVAAGLLIVATFVMNRAAFGAAAACWGLVPLTFASAGAIWLSARITGGHLLTAVWAAGALALWHACLSGGRIGVAAVLGLWCGLGLYLDRMFALVIAAIVGVAALGWLVRSRSRAGAVQGVAFLASAAIGYLPAPIGAAVDPHDAYVGQFDPVFEPSALADHATLLAGVCLPRLVGGHAPPDFGPVPRPTTLAGRVADRPRLGAPATSGAGSSEPEVIAASQGLTVSALAASLAWLALGAFVGPLRPRAALAAATAGAFAMAAALAGGSTRHARFDLLAAGATFLALAAFAAGLARLMLDALVGHLDRAGRSVAGALALLAALNAGAFLVNRGVSESDHYRYLVLLLVPWSAGFGRLLDRGASAGRGGRFAAAVVASGLALLLTVDAARWYRAYGWIDASGRPVQAHPLPLDPALGWFLLHPEAERVYGDYWDVYRLAFLTGGRLKPTPIPIYPDRFPEWKRAGGPGSWYMVARRRRPPSTWALVGGEPGARVYRWPWTDRAPWEAR